MSTLDLGLTEDRPGYRCRHGHSSAKSTIASQPGNLYPREDHAADQIRAVLIGFGIRDSADAHIQDPQLLASIARDRGMTSSADAAPLSPIWLP